MSENPRNTVSSISSDYRIISHGDTGGIEWGSLRSILKVSKSQTQKENYYRKNTQNHDGSWPEPSAINVEYCRYQKNKNPQGKIQKLSSPNQDGSETLVFSLNQNSAEDVAHQAAHYLLGNLQAELGITNTVLYADEIMIFALQAGLDVGIRP